MSVRPAAGARALTQAGVRYAQELRAYAEVARHEAANSPTEKLNDLWLRVADHWDRLAARTERWPVDGGGEARPDRNHPQPSSEIVKN